MIGRSLLLSAAMILWCSAPSNGLADGDSSHGPTVTANSGGLTTSFVKSFGSHEPGASSVAETPTANVATAMADEPLPDLGLLTSFCSGTNWTASCNPADPQPAAPVVHQPVTQELVLAAFRRIELPASDLVVQPPGGETLVNFDTNFYTEQGAFTRTVNLLGKRVELRIWPSQYQWVFGDGASLASQSAGAPYPDLLITHDYRSRGGVSPRVDTTYAARFRVDGGPWRDVDGTVTVAGQPVQLQVRTATPVLVGYH